MNKYLIFIISLLIFVTVNVKGLSANIVCQKDELLINETTICDISVDTDISFSSISFEYDSDLDIIFDETNNLNKNEKNISITLNDSIEITKGESILKMNVVGKNVGSSKIILNNIKINNANIENIEKTINVTERKTLSSNNKITDITIDGVSLNNFHPDVNRYDNIIVNKPSVFIDIKGQDSRAMITGVGSAIIRRGSPTEVNICITSEDGNVNIYTLVITYVREVVKSHDASLEMIELYNGNTRLDFVFDKDKDSYRIKVDNYVDNVDVKATLSNGKATFVNGYEPRKIKLDYGQNIVELKIESENGDIKIYTINIERDDRRSNDNTLKKFIINDVEIAIEKDRYNYEVTLPFDVLKTEIKAIPNSNKSTINYKDINLDEGKNSVCINVIAENGKKRDYCVSIIRESKIEEDVSLSDVIVEKQKELENIIIDGYDLFFRKDVHEYNLNVSNNTKELSFKIEPSDLEIEILNNKDLKDNSIVVLKVKDNGEYTIKIHKEDEQNSNMLLYLGIFCLLAIITGLFILFKKKKK